MTKPKTEFCISCGVRLTETGYTKFPCPVCGSEIGRCVKCRKQSTDYKCSECGFIGP